MIFNASAKALSWTDDSGSDWYSGNFQSNLTVNTSKGMVLFSDPFKFRKYNGAGTGIYTNAIVWPNSSIVDNGVAWQSVHTARQSVWYEPSTKKFWMAYSGSNSTSDPNQQYWQVAYRWATNPYGPWYVYSNTPILTWNDSTWYDTSNTGIPSWSMLTPTGVWNGSWTNTTSPKGIYEIWYGCTGTYIVWRQMICYANSTDGFNWVKYSGNPIIFGENVSGYPGVGYFRVWVENNTYMGQINADLPTVQHDWHINSTDGIHWSSPGYSLPHAGTQESVLHTLPIILPYNSTNNVYYAHSSIDVSSGSDCSGYGAALTMMWAYDKKGPWNDIPNPACLNGQPIPVINRTVANTFDSSVASHAQTFVSDNQLYTYYTGFIPSGGHDNMAIGLAVANFTHGEFLSGIKTADDNETTWNTATWHSDEPINTNIKIQVGYSNDSTNWVWSPNYTSSPQELNMSAKYARYKIWFTGNDTNFPTLNDITINYGPLEVPIPISGLALLGKVSIGLVVFGLLFMGIFLIYTQLIDASGVDAETLVKVFVIIFIIIAIVAAIVAMSF